MASAALAGILIALFIDESNYILTLAIPAGMLALMLVGRKLRKWASSGALLVAASAFLLPISISEGLRLDIAGASVPLFLTLAPFLLFVYIKDRRHISRKNGHDRFRNMLAPILIFVLAISISSAFATDPTLSIRQGLELLAYLGFYWLFSRSVTSCRVWKIALGGYIVGTLMLLIVSVISYAIAGGSSNINFRLTTVGGSHPNHLAIVLGNAFVVVFIYAITTRLEHKAILSTLLMVVIGIGLLLTVSRGAWLATGAGIVFGLAISGNRLHWPRTIVLMLPIFMVVVAAAIPWLSDPNRNRYETSVVTSLLERNRERISTSTAVRREIYAEYLRLFPIRPLTGTGFGLILESDLSGKTLQPHNSYLALVAWTGVLGLLGLLFFLWRHGLLLWRSRNLLCDNDVPWGKFVFSLFIVALVQMIFETYLLSGLFWGLIAIQGAWINLAGMQDTNRYVFAARRRVSA